ncbi:hypothetical protein HAZT_HAZT000649 [Hyalella azteca]|uniref:C2H2-type domain-containing protein n=1 Tax=Hyalella azteca TaxID=294128 RepID=A0A6A0HAB8_HYAAZ|nr:hypothetical protein HAZT_HAZT000649 [Hyalella azteca]
MVVIPPQMDHLPGQPSTSLGSSSTASGGTSIDELRCFVSLRGDRAGLLDNLNIADVAPGKTVNLKTFPGTIRTEVPIAGRRDVWPSPGISPVSTKTMGKSLPLSMAGVTGAGSSASGSSATGTQFDVLFKPIGTSKIKIYQCEFCDRKLYSNIDMVRHVRTHTGERPYKCPDCDYRASRKWSLQSHIGHKHPERRARESTDPR